MDRRESGKKKQIWTYVVILILLLIILLLLLQQCGRNGGDAVDSPSGQGGVHFELDPNAGEYSGSSGAEGSGVAIPGWGTITIPANTTEIPVDFYNPEANEGKYYLTFELRLPDNSAQGYEVLYTSGLVKPGLHIQKATLSRGLPAGEYQAVIHVQPYRMDEEQTPTNNANLNTKLVVK